MREIKFRAWDKENKVMIYPKGILFDGRVVNFSCGMLEPFEGCEIMQFTGLYDKNGKEIYEGDIVEFNNCDYQRTAGHSDDEIIVGEVEYSCGAWGLKEANGQLHDLYISLVNDEEAEVIGNIFQDGDLLRDS